MLEVVDYGRLLPSNSFLGSLFCCLTSGLLVQAYENKNGRRSLSVVSLVRREHTQVEMHDILLNISPRYFDFASF